MLHVMKRLRRNLSLICISILCLVSSIAVGAEETVTAFSYDDYTAVLSANVDARGWVDYEKIASDPSNLVSFLDRAAKLKKAEYEKWTDPEKIAHLLNVYNALTIKVIIDHMPIEKTDDDAPARSIRQIPDVWNRLKFDALGERISLDGIENDVLRKRFNEPRIHMALVCAARGCPALRREPYLPEKLDGQLEDQTRRFLKDPNKFRIDRSTGQVHLSRIFSWFGQDFLKSYGTERAFRARSAGERAVLNFIAKHIDAEDAGFLENGDYKLHYLEYDWSLNGI